MRSSAPAAATRMRLVEVEYVFHQRPCRRRRGWSWWRDDELACDRGHVSSISAPDSWNVAPQGRPATIHPRERRHRLRRSGGGYLLYAYGRRSNTCRLELGGQRRALRVFMLGCAWGTRPMVDEPLRQRAPGRRHWVVARLARGWPACRTCHGLDGFAIANVLKRVNWEVENESGRTRRIVRDSSCVVSSLDRSRPATDWRRRSATHYGHL